MRPTLTAAVLLTFATIAPAQRTASPRSNVLDLTHGTLVVSVKDRQGNVSRIERTFSVKE